MKKIISLLLLVVMLLSLSLPALAYDEEITWLGIPWGSSPEEALPILVEKGIIDEKTANRPIWSDNGFFLFPSDNSSGLYLPYQRKSIEKKGNSLSLSNGKLLTQIAGHDVDFIKLSYSNDGEQQKLLTVTILFKAEYEKRNETFEDLSQKLTKIYGEGERYTLKYGSDTGIIWTGKNDTIVYLESNIAVSLYYSLSNASDLLAEIPDETVDANDTFGL